MAFTDLISALRAAPTDGQRLKHEEARLVAERQLVATAAIHVDDIVAKAINGTRERAAGAIAHLVAHHLNAESMAATHPESIENEKITFDLLARQAREVLVRSCQVEAGCRCRDGQAQIRKVPPRSLELVERRGGFAAGGQDAVSL